VRPSVAQLQKSGNQTGAWRQQDRLAQI